MSINDLVELFLLEKINVVPATLSGYKRIFLRLSELIDTTQKLSQSASQDLFKKIMELDVSPATKESYWRTWKIFVKWSGEPIKITKMKHVDPPPKTIYSEEEVIKLTTKPKQLTFNNIRGWAITCMLAESGMRASTLINIKREDVDFSNNSLITRHTKNGKAQIICFGDLTHLALKYLSKWGEYEYLFTNQFGEQLSVAALASIIRRYNQSLGIERTGIHKYRHYFAKAFLKQSDNVFVLQKLLGHQSLTMTEHYAQLYGTDVIDKYVSPLATSHKHKVTYKTKPA